MTVKSRMSRAAAVAVGVILASALAACTNTGSTPPSSDPQGPTTLRMAATASGPFTDQFNPFLQATQSASGYSMSAIYEPLMVVDYAKSTEAPWLAKKGTWNSDGTKLSIELRSGVKWSDGTAFSADDVAFTFGLIGQDKALNFYGLPIKSATATDPTTVEVDFTRPAFQTLWFLTAPVQKAQWSTVADPVTFANTSPIGTGPYALKTFTPQAITLQKNTHYWQKGSPKIPSVQYLSFDSESSMDAAVEGKQVDWITTASSDPAAITSTSPKTLDSYTVNTGVGIYLFPNNAAGPTADVAVRKAISQALNRSAIASASLGPGATPTKNQTGLDGSPNLIASKYKNLTFGKGSAAAAKSTLKAAGYKQGADGYFTSPQGAPLAITLTVPASAAYGDWTRTATLITSELKPAGIKVTPKTESVVAWRQDLASGNFQLTMRASGGTGSVYDGLTSLVIQPVAPVGGNAIRNWERYSNPAAGTLLQAMAASPTGSAGYTKALDGIEEILVDDVPVVPLGFGAVTGIRRIDSFTGWPSASDPYALPVGIKPSLVQILTRLSGKG
ncbi:ABC transporter substrate-binding protein [Leifsonia shinshuensis]|uniref:ABC transporter substrate-binding protein n=1 Tax=Leifsonia shinshuensis TaxID=150026 RepID=A0A7G6YAT2_9MICO|nr:ABC transporter substrate-binding protein [Leifsonia shinshuensis]QNE35597.1 ABC transporter substrate-binding protein [Leifsonia shinshuensis]